MLVLSRKINESIQIGTDVEVTVIDVRGDVVRLGINAPQKTQIWRKELWDVIVEENRAAARPTRQNHSAKTLMLLILNLPHKNRRSVPLLPHTEFFYMLSVAEIISVRGIERPNVVEPPRPIQ